MSLRSAFNKFIDLKEPAAEPYKTHMPTLIRLAKTLKPRRVAEFGMGHFSTSLFLDRAIFPDVERLSSFDDDPEWFAVIRHKHGSDPRFEGNLVPKPMWKAARKLQASDYDLIFVDDSRNALERSHTLLALRLAKGVTKRPVIVVHDVEQPRLRLATLVFPRRTYSSALCPQTGVLCSTTDTR